MKNSSVLTLLEQNPTTADVLENFMLGRYDLAL